MQIPTAIWVTCPKGIIIPHMLSHAAGHGSRGIAALDLAPSSSAPLSCLPRYPNAKCCKAGMRNARMTNYNLPIGKYFPNPRHLSLGMSPEELWFISLLHDYLK